MTVHEYLEDAVLLLTASPVVEHFHVVTRRETESDGYFRARATLADDALLEVSSYCQATGESVRSLITAFTGSIRTES